MLTQGVSYLAQLAPIVFPSSIPVGKRRYVVLTGYLDESQQKSLDVFAIAGCIFDPVDCQSFQDRWRKVLNSAPGNIRLKRFHMTDFDSRQGDFKGWQNNFRVAFLRDLIEIIHDTAQLVFSASLDLKAFDTVTQADLAHLGVTSPYHLCLKWCLTVVKKWLHDNGNTQYVAYVCDDISKPYGKSKIMEYLHEIGGSENVRQYYRFGSHTWASSYQVPELQAADMIAFESGKFAGYKLRRSDRPIRRSMTHLLEGIENDRRMTVLIDAKLIREWLSAMPDTQRPTE